MAREGMINRSSKKEESVKDAVSILGLGKVGTAVGFFLRGAGYPIAAVASRSIESVSRGVEFTGGTVFVDYTEAARRGRCILITTVDDAIAPVCEKIVREGAVGPGKRIVHMSGACGLDVLQSAKKAGASVACIHPIQSFADVKNAIENIPGSSFGVTADRDIEEWALRIVQDLGGRAFIIADADKPLYHAAACMASNYLVTLMHLVEGIYLRIGLSRDDALRAFWPLVRGTIRNIEAKGTVQSLTGPISRGDIGTLKKHLAAFSEKIPELEFLYRTLGLQAADVGLKKGTLSPKRVQEIKTLLTEGRSK
jgi:predicted short-subunit dehydrogenase-like oxidoreductase (DUF2520 family)